MRNLRIIVDKCEKTHYNIIKQREISQYYRSLYLKKSGGNNIMYYLMCCKTSKKFGFIKKSVAILLILLISIYILTGCGNPKSSPVEDFTYEFEDGNVTITGYTGKDREVVIPDVIGDRPVTAIGVKAFESYDFTSITIPKTVTIIDTNAFNNCNLLEEINFQGELQQCGEHFQSTSEAFASTKWYENQDEGVLYLGSTAIGYKGTLPTEIIIKDGIKSIVDYAFECYSTTSARIPESVTYIGKYSVGYYHDVSTGFTHWKDYFEIYGKSGSAAERYANKEDITNRADEPFKFIAE